MEAIFPGFLSALVWAIVLGSVLLSITLGGILAYHWFKYSMNRPLATLTLTVYFVGCAVLLIVLIGASVIATGF